MSASLACPVLGTPTLYLSDPFLSGSKDLFRGIPHWILIRSVLSCLHSVVPVQEIREDLVHSGHIKQATVSTVASWD